MALSPINPTQLTPPRVALIDERSGAISREWYRFFLSLLTATQSNQEETTLGPDTASLLATYDAMLASATQASEVASDGMVASLESSLNNLQNAFGVTPPNVSGAVTSVAASGGTTGLTFTGSPITTSGTLTLGGTLAVANGGTGQTSYTDGQLLIGNTTGNTLTTATLTPGSGVSITNGAGSITISATGSGGTVTSVDLTAGTGISVSGGPITTSGSINVVNTAPDQIVSLTGAGTTSITGTYPSFTITSNDSFVGTVTSVSVVSANGFAGTVATATTTPAIILSTSVTGLVKGNGTALSAAVAATDYVAPSAYASANGLTMATSRLLGRTTASTGAAEEISVAGGLTLSGGVLTGASGTVTSVTGTAPVVSSGGATPAISMAAATASVNGYLTSTDWSTFNSKGSGTVTSVSGTGSVNGITLTGTVTSSGNLTLGGTLSGVSLTTQVSGTLPVTSGGTGVTTSTGSGSTVLSSQPSFGSTIGVGGATASASGAGVSFPASQSASTDPNTLDDYEEGSCTITIQDSAGNSATMGGSNVFRYIKVGAFVQVSGTLNWDSIASLSAGSRIQFHGLPFIVNNVGNYRAPALFGSSAPGSFNITRAEIAGGADNGNTFIFGTKVSGNNVDGAMVPADLGSSGTMYGFQINYTTTF